MRFPEGTELTLHPENGTIYVYVKHR
jgi:hypothetical protein